MDDGARPFEVRPHPRIRYARLEGWNRFSTGKKRNLCVLWSTGDKKSDDYVLTNELGERIVDPRSRTRSNTWP